MFPFRNNVAATFWRVLYGNNGAIGVYLVERAKEDHRNRRDDAHHDGRDYQEELGEVLPDTCPRLFSPASVQCAARQQTSIDTHDVGLLPGASFFESIMELIDGHACSRFRLIQSKAHGKA